MLSLMMQPKDNPYSGPGIPMRQNNIMMTMEKYFRYQML